ncbi:hypothetical protein [Meridianimarinicoccus aquatilis]|uniref:Uncharacterized protein n=1 Tax=Meridianimarinicoccus aquatilis TaxID=2552766 RepID=A0A4R6B562_9RHOB|nr:hypothetical protein [Fluviibacterium aquatile]TDL91058.1 hypothetical protein E2L05_01935 [Fluviibacterium aquatile]
MRCSLSKSSAVSVCAVALLAACGGPDFTLSGLAGPDNIAALDQAAQCNNTQALALAERAGGSDQPSEALFGQFAIAALYTDAGDTAKADAAVATAFNDPEMNPDGGSTLQEMQDGADALLEAIRQRRIEETGSATC